MRNIVRFNEQRLPNSIKSGGFNVGVNNTSTDLTGFYNGITPILSGYTIYIDKVSNGPSIYAPQNDNELVGIVNSLGGSVSTATEALVWINSQSNMTVVNGNYPSIVTDGLVLNLDAGFVSSYPRSGTTWTDLSSSGNTGTLINGPTFSSGNGGSIVFDGVNDYVESTPIQPTFFTLSSWFKSTGQASLLANGGLLANSTNRINYFLAYNWENESVNFLVQDNTGPLTVLNIFRNTIYNVVGIYNGQQRLIYINGVLAGSQNWTTSPIYTSLVNTQIGRLGFGSFTRNFNGNIYQTSIYNRALTADEILQNYYAGLQRFIPTDGLVLSLDAQNTNLYATSPTTAYDISGNGNNGTLLNGTQYISDGNGSWGFDGVDDYINIPNNSSLQVTGDQTLVFWVYPERRDRRQNFYNKAYGGEGTITYETNGSMNYYWGTAGNNTTPYQGVNSGVVMATLNTWYFVVLVRELSTPTKTVKWYINGVLINTTTASYSSATASSLPITIGTGYAGSFLGKVGIVKQYNIALTQTEITTIYNATRTRYGV
jgi:hypothetical protein